MKQKLLFSLLALLVSVGMVKAETKIVAPQNSGQITVNITSAASMTTAPIITKNGVPVTSDIFPSWTATTSKQFVLPNEATAGGAIWRIEDDGLTQITVTGNASEFEASGALYTSITVANNKLTKLKIGNTLTSLTSLNVSNNLLKSVDTDIPASLSLTTLNISNNQLSGTFAAPVTVTTLTATGNQLEDITGPDAAVVNRGFGTQTIITAENTAIANRWYDVSKVATDAGIFRSSPSDNVYSSFQKVVNGNLQGANVVRRDQTNEYRFQTSSTYEYGTYQVQVTNKNYSGRTYKLQFSVNPAIFKLVKNFDAAQGTLTVTRGGTPLNNDDEVKTDQTLKLTATPAPGYVFDKFETVSSGLKFPSGNEASVDVDVIGPTPTIEVDKQIVTAKALFKPATYKLVLGDAVSGGTFKVVDKDGRTIANNADISYDTELTVVATANAGYKLGEITVNYATQTPTEESENVSKYTFKVSGTTEIHVTFVPVAGAVKIMPVFDDDIATVTINTFNAANGTEFNLTNTRTLNVVVASENPNAPDHASPGWAIVVSQMTLNNVKPAQITTENSTPANPNSTVYKATFVVPDGIDAATLAITVAKNTAIIVTPEANVYDYDAKPKAFKYSTAPINGLDLNVTYSADGINYTSTVPTDVLWDKSDPATPVIKAYQVKYKRAAKDGYAEVPEVTVAAGVKINQGKLIITAPSSITVSNQNGVVKYVVNGGSAVLANTSTSIPGDFVPNYDPAKEYDYTIPAGLQGTSHLVSLTFVPKTEKNRDNIDYNHAIQVPVTIGNTPLDKVTIKGTLKDGVTVKVMNGDAKLAEWTSTGTVTVTKGTDINLVFTVPANVKLDKVVRNDASGLDYTPNADNVVLIGAIAEGLDFVLSTTVTGALKSYTLKELKAYQPAYTGAVVVYPTNARSAAGVYPNTNPPMTEALHPQLIEITGGNAGQTPDISFKYKQGSVYTTSPIKVGTYTIEVTITPTGTDVGVMKETVANATMIIQKAEPVIDDAKWPTQAYIGVGQNLSSARFVGGIANVAGSFAFIETGIAQANTDYTVKFVPTDKDNYKEVTAGKKLRVDFSNARVLTYDNPVNGTLRIVDNTGTVYSTGQIIPATATSLTITATPATGYVLQSLTVNGTSFTSGGTFTLGTAPVHVSAIFGTATSFAVKVNGTRGVQIVSGASGTVAVGGNYTFTLATATGDVPTVTDEDGTRITGNSSGVYVVQNVVKTKTISVSLSSPTSFTVTPRISHNGTITITNQTAPSSNYYYYGDTLSVRAVPNTDYHFMGWSDITSLANPRTIIVKGDITFGATYSPTGVDPVEGLQVYGAEGYISVAAPGEVKVTVANMTGRALKQIRVSGEERIEVPAGIYAVVVEQGENLSRMKVVVK